MSSTKSELRAALVDSRARLGVGERAHLAEAIYRNFLVHSEKLVPKHAKTVALYFPMRGEADTRPLFRFFDLRGFRCAFPKVSGTELRFYSIRELSDLKPGRFGIQEPRPLAGDEALIPDVVFVPAVAYSPDGHRIGYGAGHYDRLFASWAAQGLRSRIQTIGIAYDFQVIPNLTTDPHDEPVDAIVTDKQVVLSSNSPNRKILS